VPDTIPTQSKIFDLGQCAVHLVADDGVTLARHVFEPLAVNNNDPAPAILDETRLLKLASHQSNGGPPDPEHLRQKFLGQRKDIGIDPIPGLEQPTG
jgi:hypothetical protein